MFKYDGKNEMVTLAVAQANSIIFNEEFYSEIIRCKPFDGSNLTNNKVTYIMKKHRLDEVTVIVYRNWWKRFSPAIAYFTKSQPDTIHINYYKIKKMNKHQVTGTLSHEWIHQLDNIYDNYYMGHGSNSNVGKDNTAPYKIGRVAKTLSMRLFGVCSKQ